MKIQIAVLVIVVGLLTGCDIRKMETARHTIDSLKAVVGDNQAMNKTLSEIGVLMDSIDVNRKVLRTNMIEGVRYEAYVKRMADINQYVRKTERKLTALQKKAKQRDDAVYSAAIKRLRADLDVRTHELDALREQIERYKVQNAELVSTIDLQKSEIQDKLSQLKLKQEEMAQLQTQVDQLILSSRQDQGDALFAQAAAVEETARRTKFAPRKKKNTVREALGLYKLALQYGKTEAQERITALEQGR
ncbi:MAG TPA: hypothetical protein PLX35_09720 [Cyclobacteriaceae bacterium]|nr:hypothetical protein [Cyclobacteriaceae bacterium]